MPSTVMVFSEERVWELIWKLEAGSAMLVEWARVRTGRGAGVEGMRVGSALRVLEVTEVGGLLSGAGIWLGSVLFELVVGIELSEGRAGALLLSDCWIIVLLPVRPPDDGLPWVAL